MIAESGIHMLSVSASMMGQVQTIHPALLWDRHSLILIDAGYPGQLGLISKEMALAGFAVEQLTGIVITHQDIDHIGSLPMLLEAASPHVEVLAHCLEKPYIQGDAPLLKLHPEAVAQAIAQLPPHVPSQWKEAFRRTLENPPKAKVTATLSAKKELPCGGGLVVIPTPGHTPGHISLYHKPSGTLIAGDALTVADGQLQGPVPQHCLNYEQAKQSLQQLADYDIRSIICYHGGFYRGNCRERLAKLAAE